MNTHWTSMSGGWSNTEHGGSSSGSMQPSQELWQSVDPYCYRRELRQSLSESAAHAQLRHQLEQGITALAGAEVAPPPSSRPVTSMYRGYPSPSDHLLRPPSLSHATAPPRPAPRRSAARSVQNDGLQEVIGLFGPPSRGLERTTLDYYTASSSSSSAARSILQFGASSGSVPSILPRNPVRVEHPSCPGGHSDQRLQFSENPGEHQLQAMLSPDEGSVPRDSYLASAANASPGAGHRNDSLAGSNFNHGDDNLDDLAVSPNMAALRAIAASGGGLSGCTTVMLLRVPGDCTQFQLMHSINRCGFQGVYDFLYVPGGMRKKANRGYGFINFISAEHADAFYITFNNRWIPDLKAASFEPLKVLPADVQGYAANLKRYRYASQVVRLKNEYSCTPYFMYHNQSRSEETEAMQENQSERSTEFYTVWSL